MGWFSSKAGATPTDDDDVRQARARARRRLIGAAALMAVGVIGFPMLFETKPRVVAPGVPTVSSTKDRASDGVAGKIVDKTPSSTMSGTVTPAPAPPAAAAGVGAPPKPPGVDIVETAKEAGLVTAPSAITTPVRPDKPREDVARVAAAEQEGKARAEKDRLEKDRLDKERADKRRLEQEKLDKQRLEQEKTERAARERKSREDDARRARAALEGKDVARGATESVKPAGASTAAIPTTANGRFALQVGAFTSEAMVTELRDKLARAGLRSFTQDVTRAGVKITRVRTGPYASRDEALRAADKARSMGLDPAVVSH
jgi:DedD protein